jgi:pyridoxal phosphate enzyme (YggS family)
MLNAPQNYVPETGLAGRLLELRARLAAAASGAGRSAESVTLVAVSKGHTAAAVKAAAAAGCSDFGESYLQEALPKIEALRPLKVRWHYIGRLQANKTRAIAEQFDWVHGVDRAHAAERLAMQRPAYAASLNVCLQVNICAAAGKAGVEPAALPALAAAVAQLPRLRLRGLMCMLPEGLDPARQQQAFASTAALLQGLRLAHPGMDSLSMGMSGDFEAAIAAGATLVRIGTAIFGPRASAPDIRMPPT